MNDKKNKINDVFDNQKNIKVNYKKKISAKIKKIKLFFYYNSYERPVSLFTLWQFIKIVLFILIIVAIFYKFFLPKS